MTICIVTDIDGTICDKLPQGSVGAWEERVAKTPPKPIIPMRSLLQLAAQGGAYIIYATARREALRTLTNGYLVQHAFPTPALLEMRPDDLRLSQDMLKLRYLKKIREMGWNPAVWFEDDPATIETLRSNGVHALSC